jgi:aspartate racemase
VCRNVLTDFSDRRRKQKRREKMPVPVPTKILGVLGGMGPAASAEFCRILTAKAPARTDEEHPIVYMLSDPHIPNRTCAIQGKGTDPTKRLREDLLTIARWGADYLCVPCNTAHVFIDRFRDDLPKPFIHIVEATIEACKIMSPEGAWLLATVGTYQSGLYQAYAKKMGYTFHEVNEDVLQEVQNCLELVKANAIGKSGAMIKDIVERLWKIRDLPVAAACTELPLAYDASGLPQTRSVSSLGALADACLSLLYGDAC